MDGCVLEKYAHIIYWQIWRSGVQVIVLKALLNVMGDNTISSDKNHVAMIRSYTIFTD